MRHAKNTPNTKHLIQRGSACCGARWKVALRDAAARRQGDSRCVCSDGGAVWRALCCAVGCESFLIGPMGLMGLMGLMGIFCGRCVSSAGMLMAAICLPGEVRRPVPGCYLPGGALGVLSVGADASLRAAHCFNRLWISCSSFSWICASQHSSLRYQLQFDSCHSSFLAV